MKRAIVLLPVVLFAFVVLNIGCLNEAPSGVGGVGGGATTTSACGGLACPAGSYTDCDPGDETVACCDQDRGTGLIRVCARPAGILVYSDECRALCGVTLCALSSSGTYTCCGATDGGVDQCENIQSPPLSDASTCDADTPAGYCKDMQPGRPCCEAGRLGSCMPATPTPDGGVIGPLCYAP